MAFSEELRVYIKLDSSTFIYLDDSNIIQITTDSVIGLANPIRYSPKEWLEIEKSRERSKSLHGIFTQISGEYTLMGDAAILIRHIMYTQGYAAKGRFVIYIRNNSTMGYDLFQDAEINFEQTPDSLTETKIQLLEQGIGSDLKSNLNTPYEIPLTGSDVVETLHNGTALLAKYNYRLATSVTFDLSYIIGGSTDSICVNLLTTAINSEGLRPIAGEKSAEEARMCDFSASGVGGSMYGTAEYEKYFLDAGQDLKDVTVSYTATIDWRAYDLTVLPSPYLVRINVKVLVAKPNDTFRISETIFTSTTYDFGGGSAGLETENINVVDYAIGDVNKDERIYIVFCPEWISGSTVYSQIDLNTVTPELSRISIKMAFNSAPSVVKGYRWYKLWEKLINKFADGKYGSPAGISNYMSNPSTFVLGSYPERVIVSNGLALKGIDDTSFKLSIQDMIDDGFSDYPLGVGCTEDQVFIEDIAMFYDDTTEIADLGEITDGEIVQTNEMGSVVKYGHEFDETDTLNGTLDYNTQNYYKGNSIKTNDKPLEFVSKIVVSIYGIEKKRVEEFGKDTTGNKTNEDLYKYSVVGVAVDGQYPIRYSSVMPDEFDVYGVSYPETKYNAEFSPDNCANRTKGILNSYCYPSTAPLAFLKSERFSGLTSVFYDTPNSVYFNPVIADDSLVPSATPIYWLPYKIKGKAIIPTTIDTLMNANPYGYFSAIYKGVPVRFFADKISYKPINRNAFEFEGRLTPSVDITKLIK